ncbi:MAG: protein kinase [Planctomycetes bacterium]|nr:protein kinase [Planctomycetota bacterium]
MARRADPRLGTLVAGCRLTAPLGAGAMGAVYLATREQDGATVVVKLMAPDLLSSEVARARFVREAHALSRLPPHDNVVQLLAVALDATPPALVLEHAPGETLEALVRARGRLAPLEAARAARDVARGLAVIHAQGLVHRDVKPANVVITPAGVAKLIDFGVSRDSFLSGITAPGQLVGTTLYMAPERLAEEEDDDPDDPRGDLWSLGAVLYHLVAGAPPFDSPDLAELMDAVAEGSYPPLAEALGGPPPPGLEDVVGQLLEPDRRRRYARASDVAGDLDLVLEGRAVEVPGLHAPDGRRASLRGAARVVVGRAAGCDLVLDDPSVSERHAQLRRAAAGDELIDLRSAAGTFVDEVRLQGPALLRDGQRVRLGAVTLVYRDPRARGAPASSGGAAAAADDELARLAAAGDRRLVAWHIERAAAGAPDALAWLARTGLAPDVHTVAAWAAWWVGRRGELPPQLGPGGPTPSWTLEARRGDGPPVTRPLGPAEEVVLVGRDARCGLRLDSPQASRLHLTLARLVRRWAWRNESQHGTLVGGHVSPAGVLGDGDRLLAGDVELTVRPLV